MLERGLLDLSKLAMLDSHIAKEEKDICQLLKPLARFQTKDDHDQLVQAIAASKKMKEKIEEFEYYQSHGLKNLGQIEVLQPPGGVEEQAVIRLDPPEYEGITR